MSISVYAVDANGSVVTGYSGQVRLQESTSYGIGRVSPQVVTLSNGTWSGSVTNYRADETSINRGNVNLDAFLDSDPSINGTSDPFTVHPGPFTHVQIVVPGQSPAPGSISGVIGTPASQGAGTPFTVEVYATDDYWNPLPSTDVVRVTSSDAGASTPVSGGLNNGFASFSVTLNTVGTQTLTVNDQTNGAIQGMTSAGIQVTPSAPDGFAFDSMPSQIVAGTATAITIRAVDVGGNTIPDYDGTAVLTANTGPGSISPEQITFLNGVWTGDMTFRGAGGAVSVTCSDFASPPHFGTSASFEVLPGPYTKLQVLLPGQTAAGGTAAGFTGLPDDQNAGTSFNIIVRAVDEFWNKVPGINNNLELSSSDPFASLPQAPALSNGELIVPVTLYKSGLRTISCTDSDSTTIEGATSSQVQVLPGAYARLLLIAPGEQVAPGTAEGRAGSATDQSINFSFTVTVYATDDWFNPVGGVTDVVRLTSGDPLAELPGDTPMVDGRVDLTMRLSTGGFQQITAENVTNPSIPSSTTQVRAISSGFHLEAGVTPTAVQAGEYFDLTVKVTNDAGSVIQEINSVVTIIVQNAATQAPGLGELETTQFQLLQGQRTMPEKYTYAEDIVLIISDDAGNAPAVTGVISVSPGDPVKVVLKSDPTWVRGSKHANVTASVVDLYDNGVPAQPVTFSLIGGSGTLTPIDAETGPSGAAAADYLSARFPEIARVRATSNALSAELNIETALVDPDELPGTITNYPNPFHPNEGATTIAYKLAENARVTMKIYTLHGGLVYTKNYDEGGLGGLAGLNEVQWDGRNGDGEQVSSGGYILVVEAQRAGETLHVMRRKIAVVR